MQVLLSVSSIVLLYVIVVLCFFFFLVSCPKWAVPEEVGGNVNLLKKERNMCKPVSLVH